MRFSCSRYSCRELPGRCPEIRRNVREATPVPFSKWRQKRERRKRSVCLPFPAVSHSASHDGETRETDAGSSPSIHYLSRNNTYLSTSHAHTRAVATQILHDAAMPQRAYSSAFPLLNETYTAAGGRIRHFTFTVYKIRLYYLLGSSRPRELRSWATSEMAWSLAVEMRDDARGSCRSRARQRQVKCFSLLH